MQDVLRNTQPVEEALPAYASNWEYLSDELRYVDLLIHLQVVHTQRQTPASLLDQFRGVVISDEEIARLLATSQQLEDEEIFRNVQSHEQRTLLTPRTQLANDIAQRRTTSLKESMPLCLPALARLFQLTRFEEQCLLICLAPELDRKYEKLYAYLQDDVTRKKPSVDLVLTLLCGTRAEKVTARSMFDTQAPLLKYRLLHMSETAPDNAVPLLQRTLKVDDRIVNCVLGVPRIDTRLDPVARMIAQPSALSMGRAVEALCLQMQEFLHAHFAELQAPRRNPIFYLYGPFGAGKHSVAMTIARNLGLPLLIADVERMLSGPLPFAEAAWLLGREAGLQPAVLCLENCDALLAESDKQRGALPALLEAAKTFARVTFLLGSQVWQAQAISQDETFLALEIPPADAVSRKQVWQSQLNGHHRLADDVDLNSLAGNFRFQPGQIREAVAAAERLARWRSPAGGCLTMADLSAACRAQSTAKLSTLARKITPTYVWDDLVLPLDQLQQLKELCQQAKYRHLVYGDWGFEHKLSLGKGLNALFSGPPGTGKTMAAEVIAHELQLDLYQIDLSQVVSKYIGETEKNLQQIFREAQSGNAILFFDEADALFGKRSEVKDAHDRYANIEVGYLLQKMEEYEGITILATNLRQHLDEAFMRRLHCIVEFPFPDEEYRRQIWQGVFPREAPLGADVDFALLAREIKLPGGNIKNMGLAAAFYAASEDRVIRMPHLVQAARREYQKLGRTWNETQLNERLVVNS